MSNKVEIVKTEYENATMIPYYSVVPKLQKGDFQLFEAIFTPSLSYFGEYDEWKEFEKNIRWSSCYLVSQVHRAYLSAARTLTRKWDDLEDKRKNLALQLILNSQCVVSECGSPYGLQKMTKEEFKNSFNLEYVKELLDNEFEKSENWWSNIHKLDSLHEEFCDKIFKTIKE